jgi:hypothetical protein
MALTKKERESIIDELKPKGWRLLLESFARFGAPIAILGATGTFIAITLGAVYVAFGHVKEETEFRTKTNDRLEGILGQLAELKALTAANQPHLKENQDVAKDVLAQARQSKIPRIAESVVRTLGASFINASEGDEGAWSVSLDLAAYRSALNLMTKPASAFRPYPGPSQTDVVYNHATPKGKDPPSFHSLGFVPANSAAKLELISSPLANNSGNESLLLTGGAIQLDGYRLHHVILKDLEVYYSGGPLELKDVVFINCRFVMPDVSAARTLASEIVVQPNISLKQG